MSLTKILIDGPDLIAQMHTRLATKDSWKDLLTTGTGQALIEFGAAQAEEAVFANERSMQETFLDTAMLDTNIRERARHLGVRLNRKSPAKCNVTLMRDATGVTLTIPAYSMFNSTGVALYNRQAITFDTAVVSLDVVLYEGSVYNLYALGTGAEFQTFIGAETNFTVSEYDVQVYVDTVSIPVVTDGFWRYSGKPAVRDQTTADGRLELLFGNAYFGTRLLGGAKVQIRYAVTSGISGNDVTFSGSDVKWEADSTVHGAATTGLGGGADQSATEIYRVVSSSLFASGDRAVNKAEYQAASLNYPGVIDAQTTGQAELSPTRLSYMSLVRVALLTSTVWDEAAWLAFVTWYTQRTMYTTRYYQEPVRPVNYTIAAEIFFDSSADITQGLAEANAAAAKFVAAKSGSIGRSIYKSEVYDMLKLSNPDIKYLKMAFPTTDTITKPTVPEIKFFELDLGLWAFGSIVEYAISVTNIYDPGTGVITGESLPKYYTCTVGSTTNRKIMLDWPVLLGVSGIRIYKKVLGKFKLMADLTSSYTNFIDDGSANTTEVYPADLDTTGVWYPVCTSIALTGHFAPDRGTGTSR